MNYIKINTHCSKINGLYKNKYSLFKKKKDYRKLKIHCSKKNELYNNKYSLFKKKWII